MKKEYTLWLHWKQGDDLNNFKNDFKLWSDFFEDCRRQTMLLAEYGKQIEVLVSDTHFILLGMEETLANKLISEGVGLQFDEYEGDEEDEEFYEDEETDEEFENDGA